MLSRPATKISLTADDIAAYEVRKAARDAHKAREQTNPTGDGKIYAQNSDASDLAQTNKSNMTKEQRIGLSRN